MSSGTGAQRAGGDGAREPRRTSVSVPGKLILMGEHAVVYHRPALVAAVDLRLHVTVRDADEGARIVLPQIGVDERTDWSELRAYADRARERWRKFHRKPTPILFQRVRGEDPAHVVKIALGEAAKACGPEALRPIELSIDSQIPIGAGFGSSAATGVAVVAACLAHLGLNSDSQTLDRIALEVERRQHGLPSGVDHATVLRGGITWARNDAAGAVFMEPVMAVSTLTARIRVYDTGTPAESTGAVVSAVRDRLDHSGSRVADQLLDRMEYATRAFREQLTRRKEDPEAVVEMIREVERCLEELGVVPGPIGDIVDRIEGLGGAAKISGAGALSGDGAGCLLVYHPDPAKAREMEFLDSLTRYRVSLGAQGLRGELPR